MEILNSRWSPDKWDGCYVLEVFCVGKWRAVYARARKPRPITAKELAIAKRVISINTGNTPLDSFEIRCPCVPTTSECHECGHSLLCKLCCSND